MRASLASVVWLAAWLGCGSHPSPAPRSVGPLAGVRGEVELAEQAERNRRHDLARTHYERAVALAGTDPASASFARREFAETLITWGEYEAAIGQLEAAVAVRPADAAAWHDLGILRHQAKDNRGAAFALEQARTLAPRDPRPRIALAALKLTLGDHAGARREYQALLELDLPPRVREKVQWVLANLAKQPVTTPLAPGG